MVRSALVSLFLIVGWAPLSAQGTPSGGSLRTGNDFYSMCKELKIAEEPVYAGACAGYVTAFRQQADFMGQSLYCDPPEVTHQQVMDIWLAYLRDNPAHRHKSMVAIGWGALIEAYPCDKD